MLHDLPRFQGPSLNLSAYLSSCAAWSSPSSGDAGFFLHALGQQPAARRMDPVAALFEDTLMLGLQFLMAADIIGTISDPDLQGVIVLSVIVLLRVILSLR